MTFFVHHGSTKPAVWLLAQRLRQGEDTRFWPQWLQLMYEWAHSAEYFQALREQRDQLKLTQMMKSAGYLDD